MNNRLPFSFIVVPKCAGLVDASIRQRVDRVTVLLGWIEEWKSDGVTGKRCIAWHAARFVLQ